MQSCESQHIANMSHVKAWRMQLTACVKIALLITRRPPPKKQANRVAVRRSNRAAPSAPKVTTPLLGTKNALHMNVVWEGRKHVLTVLRTDRSIVPVQDAHKPKAKKAPAKKGKGKAAGTKRKAPASRSRSGSR